MKPECEIKENSSDQGINDNREMMENNVFSNVPIKK